MKKTKPVDAVTAIARFRKLATSLSAFNRVISHAQERLSERFRVTDASRFNRVISHAQELELPAEVGKMLETRRLAFIEMREALPAVLEICRKHQADASAIYHFFRDAGNWSRKRDLEEDDVNVQAALDNLELHAASGKPPVPPQSDVDDKPLEGHWSTTPLPKSRLAKFADIDTRTVERYYGRTGIRKRGRQLWIVRLDNLPAGVRERIEAACRARN